MKLFFLFGLVVEYIMICEAMIVCVHVGSVILIRKLAWVLGRNGNPSYLLVDSASYTDLSTETNQETLTLF